MLRTVDKFNIVILIERLIMKDIYRYSTEIIDNDELYKDEQPSIGEIFTFGHYKQGHNDEDKLIEWIILDIKDDSYNETKDVSYLVISRYCLDMRKFNDEEKEVTWEKSDIRKWLNDTFASEAFVEEEMMFIKETAEVGDLSSTPREAEDKVFLLAGDEVYNYVKGNVACKPTAYARRFINFPNQENGNCCWWARSNGYESCSMEYVTASGSVNIYGASVENRMGVRPVVWIKKYSENGRHLRFCGKTLDQPKQVIDIKSMVGDKQKIASLECGDLASFGSYIQGKKGEVKPIEWFVLQVSGSNVWLLSKYALDVQPYNVEYKDVTWNSCSLRKWLNKYFYHKAFSNEEKKLMEDVISYGYEELESKWGGTWRKKTIKSSDKVFLISEEDAHKYEYLIQPMIMCPVTDYVKTLDFYSYKKKHKCCWWVRDDNTTKSDKKKIEVISLTGASEEFSINREDICVRPAIVLNLDENFVSSIDDNDQYDDAIKEDEKKDSNFEIGSEFKFGCYPQAINGEILPIDWQVLDKKDDKILVISKYSLEKLEYFHRQNSYLLEDAERIEKDESENKYKWERSYLRKWMNGYFIDHSFTEKEKNLILPTILYPDAIEREYGMPIKKGHLTEDKIFVLSLKEIEKYFGSYKKRRCQSTALISDGDGYYESWWTRTIECTFGVMAIDGNGREYEKDVDDYICVRPAMWLALDGLNEAINDDHFNKIKPKKIMNLDINKDMVNVGDKVEFGFWKQSGKGKIYSIIWDVLDKKDDKILLLSKNSLEVMMFNPLNEKVTWQNSSIRKWLNEDFLSKAFSDKEAVRIQDILVTADPNEKYDVDAGKDTVDKVFLLSIKEVETYFKTDDSRICFASNYAAKQSSESEWFETNQRDWWLRTPGEIVIFDEKRFDYDVNDAFEYDVNDVFEYDVNDDLNETESVETEHYTMAFVDCNGNIQYRGMQAYWELYVRPAIWVSLK